MDALSIFRESDPYEQLIAQMIELERRPQQTLQDQKKEQDRLKTVMTDVDSKVSALHTLVKSFTDAFSTSFGARKAEVPEAASFDVSASDDGAFGTHSLDIQRLASSDKRVSHQYAAGGTDLAVWFGANPNQTFDIDVAHPTDDNPGNRVSVSVTVSPTGTNDDEILGEISAAINEAMDQAVTDGRITSEEKASAAVVNESTGTARLTLGSGKSGFANRLTFNDSGQNLLANLGVSDNVVAEGTSGGMVTDVGTSETDSTLNSMFVLNGLTMYRASNSVTDAIDGLTLNLKQAGGEPQDFTVVANTDSIKEEVEEFISKYNEVLGYIHGKSTIDADAGVRGDLAGDSTFRTLRFSMRNDIALEVAGQPADGPRWITDLGITIEEDGTLTLSDADKLIGAVETNADAVESLFAGDDGVASRLEARIEGFVGSKGIINGRIESIESNIKRVDDRISSWDERLTRREDQLRMQFARLQETMADLQGQQKNMTMFFS